MKEPFCEKASPKTEQRIRKTLECGCIVEKIGNKWWVYALCKVHQDTYYKNPRKYLRLVNWALRKTSLSMCEETNMKTKWTLIYFGMAMVFFAFTIYWLFKLPS